jgi:hypothetical protein
MIPLIRILAASPTAQVTCPEGGTCTTGLPKVAASSHQLHEILAIFFGIAAVIAVLMIIVGALMFVTSGGNSDNATKARETITYAVIGLVVALFAEGIVAFVLGNV